MLGSFQDGAERGVLRPIPRRDSSKTKPGPPPQIPKAKVERFKASTGATLRRCFVWFGVLLAFLLGTLWDKIRRKDSVDARARRLLHVVQRVGGTLVKVAQQLSMRVDVVPPEYCRELSKLLDSAEPFPVKEAVEAVERVTKKPLTETFLAFDPDPIGSASIACVYQAVLKDGRKVAVKVRRPGIGEVFARDLKAMRWLINALEAVAIIRPGYLRNFAQEFEQTILEELNFKLEAYHQSLFVREARKFKIKGEDICTAPAPIYELLSHDVIVEDFVDGIWMWEILAAVEHNDKHALAYASDQHRAERSRRAPHDDTDVEPVRQLDLPR